MWSFNTGDCLIEVTAWAGSTVLGNKKTKGPKQNSQNCLSWYIPVGDKP